MFVTTYADLIARIEQGEDIDPQLLVSTKRAEEEQAKRDAEKQAALEALEQAKARHAERNAALTQQVNDAVATYKAEVAPLLEQEKTERDAAVKAVEAHRATVRAINAKFKTMSDALKEANNTPNYDEAPAHVSVSGEVRVGDDEVIYPAKFAF